MDTILGMLILAMIVAAIFVRVSVTEAFESQSIQFLGQEMLISRHQTVTNLGVLEGMKNGVLVFGETVVAFFLEGFSDFIAGFRFGLVGNILWGLLGWILVIAKGVLVGIGRYIVTLVMVGKQEAGMDYYIAYIISAAMPWILGGISNRFRPNQ